MCPSDYRERDVMGPFSSMYACLEALTHTLKDQPRLPCKCTPQHLQVCKCNGSCIPADVEMCFCLGDQAGRSSVCIMLLGNTQAHLLGVRCYLGVLMTPTPTAAGLRPTYGHDISPSSQQRYSSKFMPGVGSLSVQQSRVDQDRLAHSMPKSLHAALVMPLYVSCWQLGL